jgi:YYY domain-containing protein
VGPIEAASRWYVVLLLVTWALAPHVHWLCRAVADRGATLTRPLAVLIAVYPAWLLASLGATTFGLAPLIVTVLVMGASGWVAIIRSRDLDRPWLRNLVLTEAGLFATFGSYLWLRGYTPQILGTEKPMDLAFLASSARTVTIPPPDPWFAGAPINYYYLGYLLHGTIGRVAGVPPETAFNLALATIFSLTSVAAFGVAWNAVRPSLGSRAAVASGLLAPFLLVVSGNLYAPLRLIQDAEATVSAWWWDKAAGIGWRASRIVCDGVRVANDCPPPATETINEFPFFSFLLGDLHPHLMALPYTLVAVGLAWNLASAARWTSVSAPHAARLAVSGAIVGALYPLNAWDFPTFAALGGIAIWLASGATLRRAVRPIAIFGIASVAAWLPFYAAYAPPSIANPTASPLPSLPVLSTLLSIVTMHVGERTSLAEYLTVFGVPYLVGLAYVVSRSVAGTESTRREVLRSAAIAVVFSGIPGVLLSAPVLILCGVPLAVAISLLHSPRDTNADHFALGLFCAAWILSVGVELFYIRDAFDDRMNTLFKFYYQTWTLYALAAAVAIASLWSMTVRRTWRRATLAVATTAAVVLASAYPVVSSYQWTSGFAYWHGLDGIAYARETDPDDLAAIDWLAEHASPGDVVLEAAGCSYLPSGRLPFNRVAMITGIPTVVGWGNNHQRQWRAGQPERLQEIPVRAADVAAMFTDPSSDLVDRYGVSWLFLGEYETGNWQAQCDTAGPYAGLHSAGYPGPVWEEVFASGPTHLYRRLEP